jgi:HK97 family phage portal protein
MDLTRRSLFTGLLAGIGSTWSRIRGSARFPKQVENPNTQASASQDVTTALQSSAVWACCRVISEAVSALPAQIYEQTQEGKVKALKHPYYRMLTLAPNPLMTMVQFRQTAVLHMMLYGNAYAIPESIDGEVIALWLVPPERVRVQVNGSYYKYLVTDALGKVTEYEPMALMHFRLFSLDGIMGLSPIEYHKTTLDVEAAARGYSLSLMLNNGRPAGVLEYPGSMTKEQIQDIRTSWKQIHSGPQNVGNVVVLDGGTKYAALAMPPEQMEFVAQQRLSVEQIARIYGVPPHLVGALDKPTYASVEQQSLEFVQYTLQPIVTSLERTIQTVLLDGLYFYKLNLAAFERSDIKTRYAAYATGRQWGWLSVNDIRELEDMNTIPEGNIYLQPLNMIQATEQELPSDAPVGIQEFPTAA